MMVIEQDLYIPQAALPRRGYDYPSAAGRYTYRLGSFSFIRTGVADNSPTITDANTIAAARRSLNEPAIRAVAGFQLAILGTTNTRYDVQGTASRIRFNGDGTFTILGDARDAIDAAGTNRIFLVAAYTSVVIEDRVIYPADRCTWVQNPSLDGNGYYITEAQFYNGAEATGVSLTSTAIPGGHVGTVRLGFIGKSGRFVAITDSN